MSSAKKRKIADESSERIDRYVFLYRGKRKTVLFKVQNAASSLKKENLKRHYKAHHPELESLNGELRRLKIEELNPFARDFDIIRGVVPYTIKIFLR